MARFASLMPFLFSWTVHGQYTPECYFGMARMNFQFANFDQYPRYFTEASSLTLAEAGTYTGLTSIQEYVMFATSDNPFLTMGDFSFDISLMGIENGICHFATPVLFKGQSMQSPAVSSGAHTVSVMAAIYYDWSRDVISKIRIHYDAGFLSFFFHWAVNTRAMRTHVCEIMRSKCSGVWEKNHLSSGACEEKMSLLDLTSGGYVDGNSQGCRILHATMASMNSQHCPHLSFTPMEDDCGKMKCQESKGMRSDLLFSPAEFAFYRDFQTAHGLTEAGWSLGEVSCSRSTDCPATYGCIAGYCTLPASTSTSNTRATTWSWAPVRRWIFRTVGRVMNYIQG